MPHRSRNEHPASFLEDLIDACVMECYFREHMAERDVLFHGLFASSAESFSSFSRSWASSR